jgi:hypothetical protein
MCDPSGDQLGPPVIEAFIEVNCTGFVPSAFEIQISIDPPRLDTKTSRFPSAENCGLRSSLVEAANCFAASATTPGPESVNRQICEFADI